MIDSKKNYLWKLVTIVLLSVMTSISNNLIKADENNVVEQTTSNAELSVTPKEENTIKEDQTSEPVTSTNQDMVTSSVVKDISPGNEITDSSVTVSILTTANGIDNEVTSLKPEVGATPNSNKDENTTSKQMNTTIVNDVTDEERFNLTTKHELTTKGVHKVPVTNTKPTIKPEDLESIFGGATLNPNVVIQAKPSTIITTIKPSTSRHPKRPVTIFPLLPAFGFPTKINYNPYNFGSLGSYQGFGTSIRLGNPYFG